MEAMHSEPSGRSEAGPPPDSDMANLFNVPRRPSPPQHLLHQARQHINPHPRRTFTLRNPTSLLPELRHLHRPPHHPHLRPPLYPHRPPLHRPLLRHHGAAAHRRGDISIYCQHGRRGSSGGQEDRGREREQSFRQIYSRRAHADLVAASAVRAVRFVRRLHFHRTGRAVLRPNARRNAERRSRD
ncbi:hypothetical protein TIFTF001_024667 [Ficus carica]|uniref:Uncharacterized protein n=1 Tax=Ficus carica TaxID=3494 RepID=A0AA88ALQ8_FICCA|nr:hypothetical protein TIFTF001_024667 [Ficus carica]